MKKKIFLILILIILLIVIAITLMKLVFSDKKQDDKISYYCTSGVNKSDYVSIENYYELYYKNDEIINVKKMFKVVYSIKEEYDEAYYSQFFEENNPYDDIMSDDDNLTRIYIWSSDILAENNGLALYLNELEQIGYICSEDK